MYGLIELAFPGSKCKSNPNHSLSQPLTMPRKAAPSDQPAAPARRSGRIKDLPKPVEAAKKPVKPRVKQSKKDGEVEEKAKKVSSKKRKADEINGDGEEKIEGNVEGEDEEEPAPKKVRPFMLVGRMSLY